MFAAATMGHSIKEGAMLMILCNPRLRRATAAGSLLIMLAACGTSVTGPQTGTLSRNLNMVDNEGRVYGTVEMTPIGGGRVYDTTGRVIGDIVPPER
jgi:hypothetical protein